MEKIKHYPIIHRLIPKDFPSITKNNNISIITSFTNKDEAVLVKQLEENDVDYINAAENIEKFNKAFKPVYYYNSLKDVNTEYVLLLDSYDTIINDLNEIEDMLDYYNKDILYASWYIHFPTYFDIDFSVPEENERKYLNSGVVFGKTSKVKEFYKNLSEYISNEYPSSDFWLKNYEQYWIYKYLTENKVNNLGIDYDEKIVKNINNDI